MIIGGYYRCLTGSKWTVSSSFRGAESENRRWWHFEILEIVNWSFERAVWPVMPDSLMVEVANTQNRVLQPMAIPMICTLRRFRSAVACSLVYKRCPSTYHISNPNLAGKYCACARNFRKRYHIIEIG